MYEQLLGTNGFADVNRDGKISILEKIDALDRANAVKDLQGTIKISEPKIEGLRKAIKSYVGEQN